MDKGFVIFAIDNLDTKYSQLAYACAVSIKITQPLEYSRVSVITNNKNYFLNGKIKFDKIIEIDTDCGMDSRSLVYDLSPYAETILLDADCLVLDPIDYYWSALKTKDLFISTHPQTYEHKTFQYGPYRKIFEKYVWPDVYSAFTYFKKNSISKEFFDIVKFVTKNQKDIIENIFDNDNIGTIPTDEAFALALILANLEDVATGKQWDFPKIIHMKPGVQDWNDRYTLKCSDKVKILINHKLQVKVGNYRQTGIWHYVEKNIITNDLILNLEKLL